MQDVAWDERPKVYHTDCDVEYREGREAGDERDARRFPMWRACCIWTGDGRRRLSSIRRREEATGNSRRDRRVWVRVRGEEE